jgi:cobalt-zinc-cadmium efflux system membrane fusion protein
MSRYHYCLPITTGLLTALILLSGCHSVSKTDDMEVEEKAPPNEIHLSEQAVSRLHLQAVAVTERDNASPLQVTATVMARRDSVYPVSSLATGRLLRDFVQVGQHVRNGQILALVQNTEIAKIQAAYLHELHSNEIDIEQARIRAKLAQQSYIREKKLLQEDITPRRDFQQAEANATLAQATLAGQEEHRTHIQSEGRALLSVYGLKPGGMHAETIRSSSPLTAPHAGIVTQKLVTVGAIVSPDKLLYEIADLSQVWLEMTVFPQDLVKLKPNLPVAFTLDSQVGKTFHGHLDYLPVTTQAGAQTVLARATLDNSSGLLRPGMLGLAQIAQPVAKRSVFLPQAAIQHYGREVFVFLPTPQAGLYRKQTVRLGPQLSDGALVEAGLKAGQTVVGQGSFALKAELLKDLFSKTE